MLLSNSVLRRYTLPNCTLEIVVRTSPLYRWVGRPVTTLLSFQLRFDDPRLPEEERVTIAGDRDQLEALYEAVTTYVQDLLNQSPDRFSAMVCTPTAAPSEKIFLQPGSGLAHNLFLGSLETKGSRSVIQLSMLQLVDLATALDKYAAQLVELPGMGRLRLAYASPAWASIAAILLLSVSLTTAMASSAATRDASTATELDTIPQVAEVRDYFKRRWEPPQNFKETLEYNLLLDIDGTIERIEPLGQAARNYVDRIGMPLIGERFVSPIKSRQTPTILVILTPDGKVQTFLESLPAALR